MSTLYNDNMMMEITAKLSGAILRKAEMEDSYHDVYSMVFEKMFNIDPAEGDEFLMVFGNIGG